MTGVPEVKEAPLSLVERKQRAARGRIIEAADTLFAERGFDDVSVTDIADRAEVGRTTFFRHFSDKTEVVFAKEQALFDTITDSTARLLIDGQLVDSLAGALSALEPLVVRLCELATADLVTYERHTRLLDAHEELRAREALKHQEVARRLAQVLLDHDASIDIATLAAHLAVACYSSGRALTTEPRNLVANIRDAFRSTLAMSSASKSEHARA